MQQNHSDWSLTFVEVTKLFQKQLSGADTNLRRDQQESNHTICRQWAGQYESSTKTSLVWMLEKKSEVPTSWTSSLRNQPLHQEEDIAAMANRGCHLKRRITWVGQGHSIEAAKNGQLQASLVKSPISRKRKSRSSRHRSIKKQGNILLYGSPGTGKTHFPTSNSRNGSDFLWAPQKIWLCICQFRNQWL